ASSAPQRASVSQKASPRGDTGCSSKRTRWAIKTRLANLVSGTDHAVGKGRPRRGTGTTGRSYVARRSRRRPMLIKRSMKRWLLLPSAAVLVGVGACGRGSANAADDALKNDLALASQMQPYQPQQMVSPQEQGYGAANGYGSAQSGYPQRIQTV